MSELAVWMADKLCQLNLTHNMNHSEGFSRLGYTEEEASAQQAFVRIAQELGLVTSQDQAGNVWAVWDIDHKAKTIAMGSHLDTVYNGGGYDGVAGVLCALAAVKILKDKQFRPHKNIAVICFASEESARFGISTLGSKAISGQFEKAALAEVTDCDGITVKQAMEDFGLKWDEIEQAALPEDHLACFLELHIEQGEQLQAAQADIGIVHGVARPIRLMIKAIGMSNHTGTTPMDRRQDAFVAISPLIRFINEEALKAHTHESPSLVATVSTIHLKPNAMNMIPGEVELGIDIRSVDDNAKQSFVKNIKDYCFNIEQNNDVSIEIQTLVNDNSVTLDDHVMQKLIDASKKLGLQTQVMDSGAGHDVMNMAHKWPSGLIFIPCKNGISHHPEESTSINELIKGTQVIQAFIENESHSSD
ncbi:M20 family metallo-hydrolase [Tuberibacillus sp. Marseille-P3662]|uniref:M20 family metallo-hydrolase n=1 Tax=Tuberibacillus sp. Marseille-P3662 TaxID=1965358 RepID=UPI000A1C83FC|nr:M20 family metallo-hydrolase [Tuberibacillus sp. Marseille-P3662]